MKYFICLTLFVLILTMISCQNSSEPVAPPKIAEIAESENANPDFSPLLKPIIYQDELLYSFSFNMRIFNFYESPPLEYGVEYFLVVSGTYNYSYNNLMCAAFALKSHLGWYDPPAPLINSDAPFMWDDGDDVYPEGYYADPKWQDYDHRPSPDEYNSDNIFYYYFTGDGTSEKFQWHDGGGYGDNGGGLNFEIWKRTPVAEPELFLTPDTLWPANHKLVSITAYIVDYEGATLTSITSNEPDDDKGHGDGKTVNDIQSADYGTADYQFLLRAERAGTGTGRIYTITYDVGIFGTLSAEVIVPHNQ